MQIIFNRRSCAFLIVALLLFELVVGLFGIRASAASVTYSNVLDDLERDPEFHPEDYPSVVENYSLEVIQVAEGENGELFLYVYQPGNAECDVRATYVNMSLQSRSDANPAYNLYSLTWLNTDGVFSKYLINGVSVLSEEYRYYNIAAIYRPYDEMIDDPTEESDDVNEHIGFPVGLCYCAYSYNGTVVYECEKVDIVDVEILAVGSVRYTEGFKLFVDKCDAHFVAFSVENFDVDKIFDATVVYTIQEYDWSFVVGSGEKETYSDPVTTTKDISSMETASNDGDGLFGVKYTWQRILTKDAFEAQLEDSKNEDIVFSKGGLGSAEFVFQFLETDYTLSSGNGITIESSTKVTDVGILRLHFLSEGKHYNLGVVSDLVSDDGSPDFEITIGENFENQGWWLKLMGLLVLILVVSACGPLLKVLSFLFKAIFRGVGFLLNLLFEVLKLPFRLIGFLNKK